MRIFKIIVLLVLTSLAINTSTLAYWAGLVEVDTLKQVNINIGSWLNTSWEVDYNLNIWEDNNVLNQQVPEGIIFSYNNLLYTVREGENYNPQWHGLPGQVNSRWAMVALDLDWKPNSNYRVNSVVVRDSRWFIANYKHNTDDWFITDPLDSLNTEYSHWREIEPIAETNFGFLLDTTLRDYSNPDFNFIVYKGISE